MGSVAQTWKRFLWWFWGLLVPFWLARATLETWPEDRIDVLLPYLYVIDETMAAWALLVKFSMLVLIVHFGARFKMSRWGPWVLGISQVFFGLMLWVSFLVLRDRKNKMREQSNEMVTGLGKV